MPKPYEVTVTYTDGAAQPWSFDPVSLPVKKGNDFKILRADGSTWTFNGAAFANGYNPDPIGNGEKINVHDNRTISDTTTYSVSITLSGGEVKTSPPNRSPIETAGGPPPMLVNSGT